MTITLFKGIPGMLAIVALMGSCMLPLLDSEGSMDASDQTFSRALRTINVTANNALSLQTALLNAQAGDEIIIPAGNYYTSTKADDTLNTSNALFFIKAAGTAANPIIIRAADPNNKPVLGDNVVSSTTGINAGNVMQILGNVSAGSNQDKYITVMNLKMQYRKKGLLIDRSNHVTVDGVEVSFVGQEAIHIRDKSSNNLVKNTKASDTGLALNQEGYGEGFYVGTDKGAWATYHYACYDNVFQNNTTGPNITAEHFDIKEGTLRTIVEGTTMNGTKISGANSANTFINDKGKNTTIRNNIGNRNGNVEITCFGDVSNRDTSPADTGVGGWWYGNSYLGAETSHNFVQPAEKVCTAFYGDNYFNGSLAAVSKYASSGAGTITWTFKAATGASPSPATSPSPSPSTPASVAPSPSPAASVAPGTAFASHNFDDNSISGGSGWAGSWTYDASGDAKITNEFKYAGTYSLQTQNITSYAERIVNLSAKTNVSISFMAMVSGVDEGESVALKIYDGAWKTVKTWTTDDADDLWKPLSYSLAAYNMISGFKIRFESFGSSSTDELFIDNLELLAGSAPAPSPSPAPSVVPSPSPVPSASPVPSPSPSPVPSPSPTPAGGVIAAHTFEDNLANGGTGWAGAWVYSDVQDAIITTEEKYAGTYSLQVQDITCTADRTVNLAGKSNVSIRFMAMLSGVDAGETVSLKIYDGAWKTVKTWTTTDADDIWRSYTLSLSSYTMISGFKIRFETLGSSSTDELFVDNLEIFQ